MSEEKKIQLIDLYLSGQLSPEEIQEIESRIVIDEDFAAEVDLTRQIMLTMQDRELIDFHQRISEAWDHAVPAAKTEAEPDLCRESAVSTANHRPARAVYWVVGGAMAFLALFIVVVVRPSFLFPVQRPSELTKSDSIEDQKGRKSLRVEEPAAEVRDATGIEPDIKLPDSLIKSQHEDVIDNALAVAGRFYEFPVYSNTVRKDDPIVSAGTLAQAQAAFEAKDYNKAIRLLSGTTNKSRDAVYLEGHIYFCLKDFAKSSTTFNSLRSPGKYLGDKADWFFALSRLAEKGASDRTFSSALSAMLQDQKHEFHEKALSLNKAIRGQ